MIIRKYSQFLDTKLINENLEAARTYLRKRILEEEKKKNPELNFTLADLKNYQKGSRTGRLPVAEKMLAVDNDPKFVKLREILKDNQGWLFSFTKFLYEDGATLEELQSLINRIREKSPEDTKLLKPADSYASITRTPQDNRTGYEHLIDDLNEVEKNRLVLNWIRALPGDFVVKNENRPDFGKQVPSFKRAAREATGKQKEQIKEIAIAFNELSEDPEVRKALLRVFASNCLRYRTLTEVITEAYTYIDASSKRTIQELLLQIDEANLKFGFINGAEIVLIKDDIVVFEVKSFQANKLINSSTKHCIKDTYSQWENYVSGENNFNKQYYIWDFNKSPADVLSIIGVTVEPKWQIRAAHSKNDDNIKHEIVDYIKNKLGIDFKKYFLPMSPTEVEQKKKRVEANREILKTNLTLETVKKLIEDGADPNHKEGKPLENAVKSGDVNLINFLLDKGAKATIGRPMRFARNFDTIALLIKNGAQLEDRTIDSCVQDIEAVKFFLDNGLDPNNNNSAAVVSAIRKSAADSLKLLLEAGGEVYLRYWRALKIALAIGNEEVIDLVFEHLKKKKQKIDKETEADILEHIETQNIFAETFPEKSEKELSEYKDYIILKVKNEIKKLREL